MSDPFEIKKMILDRRAESGLGLYGSCASIARWLFKDHKIVTTDVYVSQVIAADKKALQ